MRAIGAIPLALLAACSDSGGTSNNVDVSAAATRAETDIANYAAARRDQRAARRKARPVATPIGRDAGGDPILAK